VHQIGCIIASIHASELRPYGMRAPRFAFSGRHLSGPIAIKRELLTVFLTVFFPACRQIGH
jgi:hypothetical protein